MANQIAVLMQPLCRRVWGHRAGVVSTEFALITPVLILLWSGLIEVSHMMMVSSRVVAASQTAADLLARDTCVTTLEMNDLFAALDLIMTPYPSVDAAYDVASVVFDGGSGAPYVAWRENFRGAVGAEDDFVAGTVNGLGQAGESVIVSMVRFTYRPIFTSILDAPIDFSERAVYRPRKARQIQRDTCV